MANSKTKIILKYMKDGGIMTDMKAVELCQNYRLSGTIYNLRKSGYDVQDRWVRNENTGTKYKEYFIPEALSRKFGWDDDYEMPTPF